MKAPSNPSLSSSSPDQEIDYTTILEIRRKLLNLLKNSTKYNAATLLGRITDEMNLYEESVLLHSRVPFSFYSFIFIFYYCCYCLIFNDIK